MRETFAARHSWGSTPMESSEVGTLRVDRRALRAFYDDPEPGEKGMAAMQPCKRLWRRPNGIGPKSGYWRSQVLGL